MTFTPKTSGHGGRIILAAVDDKDLGVVVGRIFANVGHDARQGLFLVKCRHDDGYL